MPINGSSICKFPGENGVYKELNCRKSSGDNYGDKGMLRGCSVDTGYFLWQRESRKIGLYNKIMISVQYRKITFNRPNCCSLTAV